MDTPLIFDITLTAFVIGALVCVMGLFAICADSDDAGSGIMFLAGLFTAVASGLTALYHWFWTSTDGGPLATLIGAVVLAAITGLITWAVKRDARRSSPVGGTHQGTGLDEAYYDAELMEPHDAWYHHDPLPKRLKHVDHSEY